MAKDCYEAMCECRPAWAVEKADGPACWWPLLVPRGRIAQYCIDRQGMGVPEECLPLALACFSVCGWKLVRMNGRLGMESGCAEPTNKAGCLKRLETQLGNVGNVFLAWEKLQRILAWMEARKPEQAHPAQPEPQDSKPRRRAWTPRVARRR